MGSINAQADELFVAYSPYNNFYKSSNFPFPTNRLQLIT